MKIAKWLPLFICCFVTTAFATPPMNLSCAKNQIKAYYQSGEYEKDVAAALQDAERYLDTRVADNQAAVKPRKLAIVLDIDDTSLSNFESIKADDFAGLTPMINAHYRAANAPAIQPVLHLYREAIKKGVSVIFITFRPDTFRADTINNLHRAGYANWSALYLANHAALQAHASFFKTALRKNLTGKQGYDIILNIGDQESDLMGGYADRTVKIPNPLYSTSRTPCDGMKDCRME